jgi:hypothetical protein
VTLGLRCSIEGSNSRKIDPRSGSLPAPAYSPPWHVVHTRGTNFGPSSSRIANGWSAPVGENTKNCVRPAESSRIATVPKFARPAAGSETSFQLRTMHPPVPRPSVCVHVISRQKPSSLMLR